MSEPFVHPSESRIGSLSTSPAARRATRLRNREVSRLKRKITELNEVIRIKELVLRDMRAPSLKKEVSDLRLKVTQAETALRRMGAA